MIIVIYIIISRLFLVNYEQNLLNIHNQTFPENVCRLVTSDPNCLIKIATIKTQYANFVCLFCQVQFLNGSNARRNL